MTTMLEASPRAAGRVMPTLVAGRHTLAWGDVSFQVDAAQGARVTGLYIGGRNLMTGPEVDPGNFGSTFWPSPQTAWGWPPVPEIDHGPYQAAVEGPMIVMRGATSPLLGVSIEKRFAADAARGAIVFDFRILNQGTQETRLAPWQITRVGPGGLSFFPTGAGSFPPSNLAVREVSGVTWYAFDAAAVTDHQKLFADGREGWLAHLDGDALLVKTFAAVPREAQAPGEAQIELYATPAHTYVEVEAQGAYETIAPGGSSTWEVVWLVRRVPSSIDRSPGSAGLLDYVRALVREDEAARAAPMDASPR